MLTDTPAMYAQSPRAAARLSIHACLLVLFVVLAPLSSAVRGISAPLGNIALLFSDLLFILAFAVAFIRTVKLSNILIVALILYSLVFLIADSNYPGFYAYFLGFRKSVYFLMALTLGLQLSRRDMQTLLPVMKGMLIVICLYGIKQYFFRSSFDMALLQAQAADVYSNQISGQTRSTSFLSSGFHLGMAGVLLMNMATYKRKTYLVDLLFAVIAFGAIYVSFTRTFLIIAVFLLFARMFLFTYIRFFVASLFFVFLALLVSMFEPALLSFQIDDARLLNRASSYIHFWESREADPLKSFLGFGIGSAGSTLWRYFPVGNWIEPHNVFLKYIFEFGPLWAVVIFLWVAQLTKRSMRLMPQNSVYFPQFILALLLTIVISGLTITSVEALPISLFIAILITAAPQIFPKEHKSDSLESET